MNLKDLQTQLNAAITKQELYTIAGILNNRPEHDMQDKVTCLECMDFDYAKKNVQIMLDESAKRILKEGSLNKYVVGYYYAPHGDMQLVTVYAKNSENALEKVLQDRGWDTEYLETIDAVWTAPKLISELVSQE